MNSRGHYVIFILTTLIIGKQTLTKLISICSKFNFTTTTSRLFLLIARISYAAFTAGNSILAYFSRSVIITFKLTVIQFNMKIEMERKFCRLSYNQCSKSVYATRSSSSEKLVRSLHSTCLVSKTSYLFIAHEFVVLYTITVDLLTTATEYQVNLCQHWKPSDMLHYRLDK